jgi:tetratricopeptide (TPR) repeat protein
LKLNPHDPNILNNLSYYAALSGDYTNAVRYANDGLKYVKDQQFKALLLNNRGYGLINLNKNIEGLADINNSINLNPDNPFAYCYRAIANIHLKHWKTVCDDLNKAKRLGAKQLTSDLIVRYCNN